MDVHEIINFDEIKIFNKKKRVCAYARVSTLKDLAHDSFDTQVKTYTEQIMNNPE